MRRCLLSHRFAETLVQLHRERRSRGVAMAFRPFRARVPKNPAESAPLPTSSCPTGISRSAFHVIISNHSYILVSSSTRCLGMSSSRLNPQPDSRPLQCIESHSTIPLQKDRSNTGLANRRNPARIEWCYRRAYNGRCSCPAHNLPRKLIGPPARVEKEVRSISGKMLVSSGIFRLQPNRQW